MPSALEQQGVFFGAGRIWAPRFYPIEVVYERFGGVYDSLGSIKSEQGDYPAAITNFSEALSLYEEALARGKDTAAKNDLLIVIGNCERRIGVALVEQKKWSDSIPHLKEAFKLSSKDYQAFGQL